MICKVTAIFEACIGIRGLGWMGTEVLYNRQATPRRFNLRLDRYECSGPFNKVALSTGKVTHLGYYGSRLAIGGVWPQEPRPYRLTYACGYTLIGFSDTGTVAMGLIN